MYYDTPLNIEDFLRNVEERNPSVHCMPGDGLILVRREVGDRIEETVVPMVDGETHINFHKRFWDLVLTKH